MKRKKQLRGISLLASSSCMASLALASPFACCSRVTFREPPDPPPPPRMKSLLEGYSGIRNFNAIAGSPVVECE